MVDQVFFPNPVQPVRQDRPQSRQTPASGTASGSSFASVLDAKLPAQGVKFSQHAQERLKARNINLSASDLANLEGAVDSVARKGGKESLVMMGDAALVVSIKNRTVVTAMDRTQMQGNVFTNIDSAVII
ncbi:TIGR02530 family flagellar biosynthesis protein [Geobacter sp. SVR]|uniref:TIGR02530 family flagellar biosynthesis protein n=1 Tax=Geobacter sp. SVR TaxID=2495594 RepID=UPI00143EF4EF|nr:TIGR02530 family flagellar biosynthesis protein [Geobacter sp. SVR]BCS55820.1 flagellar protein [Geobacter sp. SVR]GCF83824.1 flagellar protein [Geobacter sp. SVR]